MRARATAYALPDIDAALAQDRVSHRDVEVDVRNRHLKKIVFSTHDLAGRPGEADLAAFGTFILGLGHAFDESDRLANAGAQFLDGPLIILVVRRGLSGEPRGRGLHIVASALHLIDQRLHVGRETPV